MPQEVKPASANLNIKGGLPEGTEIVLLLRGEEVLKTDVIWFDKYFDAEGCVDNWPVIDLKVLSSKGWTELGDVARRQLWEHESTVTVMVRKGKTRLACGTILPIIRSGKETKCPVESLMGGDTVIMHDYMMLRKNHTDPKKQVVVRPQGVMSNQKSPGEGARVYNLPTASGDIIANSIIVLTGQE
jgi:hypothetical protein